MSRVLVIGLDCVPPSLAFERYRPAMPNLGRLMDMGAWAELRSTIPPITVPAWASMLSGYDPGELGVYGFRNRIAGSYKLDLATSDQLQRPMLWERLDKKQRVCALFVPPSYPPRPVQGELVSCFLTPDGDAPHTFPATLGAELRERFGPYQPDVEQYRTDQLDELLRQLYATTEQHFSIACHMQRTRQPDLTVMVEIGPDRLHHAFWTHLDPRHPRHDPASPFVHVGRDYYSFVDAQVGRLLRAAGPDVNVIVISDHGARPLLGCVHVNEWLIQHGYLVVSPYPERLSPWSELQVDWSRTRAFGEGGYYGRIILNVAGREPQGIVPPAQAAALCRELQDELTRATGPRGEPLSQRVLTPAQCYREQRGLPPDLMVFWDDLALRSSAAVGGHTLFSATNDTGPDACNHDWHGIFVAAGPAVEARGPQPTVQHADVAVSVLSLLELPASDLPGRDRTKPCDGPARVLRR